ncbi:MAG: hypothetical protein IJW96_05965, partial [Clostridia bacterium]|nr:hypothetical protein [Clostridia bacterium]
MLHVRLIFGLKMSVNAVVYKTAVFLRNYVIDIKNRLKNEQHTFATTCVQYVRPDIVDTWMGDSSERLVGRVYTHFPDKFMTAQMDLVQFE